MKITNRDHKYFQISKDASVLATFKKEKIGSIIVLRNEVIAVGYNRNKTHPLQAYYATKAGRPQAIWIHAEMSALSKLNREEDLSLCKIYVYRETKNEKPALARPCEICTEAIKDYGINDVYYSTNEGYAYEFFQ